MKKRMLSILLALSLILGLTVAPASAAEGTVTTAAELKAAVEAANGTKEAPTEIVLGGDITLDQDNLLAIPAGKYVKLTSGTAETPYSITVPAAQKTYPGITLTQGGLTLENITVKSPTGSMGFSSGNGMINVDVSGSSISGEAVLTLGEKATVTNSQKDGIVIKRATTVTVVPSVVLLSGAVIENTKEYGITVESLNENAGHTAYTTPNLVMDGGTIRGCGSGGVNLNCATSGIMNDGEITGSTEANANGLYINGGSSFHMKGGTISDHKQAGIVVKGIKPGGGSTEYFSKLVLDGGTITGNQGGGISIGDVTEVTMNGGTITQNTTTGNGGGISVGGIHVQQMTTGKFVMHGGTITENSAKKGGGVYLDNYATVILDTAQGKNIKITGNTQSGGEASNFFMANSGITIIPVTITKLEAGDVIGMRTADTNTRGEITNAPYDGTKPEGLTSDLPALTLFRNVKGDHKDYLGLYLPPDPPVLEEGQPADVARLIEGKITAEDLMSVAATADLDTGMDNANGDAVWYQSADASVDLETDTPLEGGAVAQTANQTGETGPKYSLTLPVPSTLTADVDSYENKTGKFEPKDYYFFVSAKDTANSSGLPSHFVQSRVAKVTVVPYKYPVSFTLTGFETAGLPDFGNTDEALTFTLVPSSHYKLPESITVTMDGVAQDSAYNKETGTVTVDKVTGKIAVTANGVLKSPDATLRSLTAKVGEGEAVLDKDFKGETTGYAVELDYSTPNTTQVTITGEKKDPLATLAPDTLTEGLKKQADSYIYDRALTLTVLAECQDAEGEVESHPSHPVYQSYTVTFTRHQTPTPAVSTDTLQLADHLARSVDFTLNVPDFKGDTATPGYKVYSDVAADGMGAGVTTAKLTVDDAKLTLTDETGYPKGENETKDYYVSVTLGDNESKALKLTVKAAPYYDATIDGGTTRHQEKETVSYTAAEVKERKIFDKWTATGVTLTNAETRTGAFSMPAQAVTLASTYKVKPVESITDPGVTHNQTWYIGDPGLTPAGTVAPTDATYTTIVWSVKDAGATGGKMENGTFTATAEGTATLTATVENGVNDSPKTDFTQDYTVNVAFRRYSVNATGGTVTTDPGAGKTGYKAGDSITVTTVPAEHAGKVFVGWTGSGVTFADASATTTTFTMPAKDVTVTAVYKDFVAVTGIQGVSDTISAVPNKAVSLPNDERSILPETSYAYERSEAIVWTFQDETHDGATLTHKDDGNGFDTFTATQEGTYTLVATIADGLAVGTPFTKTYTVNVAYPRWAVTVEGGTLDASTPGQDGKFKEGETVKVVTDPTQHADQVFVNWTSSDAELTDAAKTTASFTMPPKPVTVTANYKGFQAVTGIAGVPEKAAPGMSLALPTAATALLPQTATAAEQGKTVSWTVKDAGETGAKIENGIFTATAEGTATITAAVENGVAVGTPFTKDYAVEVSLTRYTVTLTNGVLTGDSATGHEHGFLPGETVHVKAQAPEAGMVFLGWTATNPLLTINPADEEAASFVMPAADVSATAHYKAFVPVTGIAGVPGAMAPESSVDLPTAASALRPDDATAAQRGGTITWTLKSAGETEGTLEGSTFTAAKEGTAVLTATVADGLALGEEFTKDYEIMVSYKRYGLTVVGGTADYESYPAGATVAITADAPAKGKLFDRWTCGDQDVVFADALSPETTFTMPAREDGVTVTATYKDTTPVTSVQFETKELGMNELPYELGGTALPADATFREIVWSVKAAGETGAEIADNTLTASKPGAITLTATVLQGGPGGADFTQDFTVELVVYTYSVTVEHGRADKAAYPEGDTVTLTALNAPEAGWVFDHWTTEDQGVAFADENSRVTTFAMPGHDVTVTAVFRPVPATGIVLTSASRVLAGDTLALTARVLPDHATYKTVTWTLKDAGETGATLEGSMLTASEAGAVVVTATVENADGAGNALEKDFTITVSAPLTVTVDHGATLRESGVYAEGETVTILADAAPEGQVFDAWTTEDEGVVLNAPAEAVTVFAMPDHSVTVTATYKDAAPVSGLEELVEKLGGETKAEIVTGQDGTQSVRLKDNVELTEDLILTDDVTLDLNGKSVTGTEGGTPALDLQGDVTITDSSEEGTGSLDANLTVGAGAGLTLEGGSLTGSVSNAGTMEIGENASVDAAVSNSGTLDNQGVLSGDVTNAGDLTNGGALSGGVQNAETGTLVNDGTVTGDLVNQGALENTGALEGAVTNAEGGTLTNQGTVAQPVDNQGEILCPDGNEVEVTEDSKPAVVTVVSTGLTLSAETAALHTDKDPKTITLTAVVEPETATDKTVLWSSDKPNVAKVDQDGLVTAVSAGTAVITAATADGGASATCTVTVETTQSGGSGGGGGGGGGSSSKPSKPTTNPDGSVTTTTKNKDGSTTAVTEQKDGSKVVETTTKDGTTITATLPAGTGEAPSVSTTVKAETKDGALTAQLPAKDVDALVEAVKDSKADTVTIAPEGKKGEAVTSADVKLPEGAAAKLAETVGVNVVTPVGSVALSAAALGGLDGGKDTVGVALEQTGESVSISVKRNGETVETVKGGLQVTLPLDRPTPGAVAVVVLPDGTERVVRKSAAVDGGLSLRLEGSATVKLADRSKSFQDVPETHWAASAVAFASSHDLFQGVSDSAFAPDSTMSRAMLVTVLHRLEDEADSRNAVSFPDVDGGAYYAQAVAWASEHGIVTGTGDGFDPDGEITREQLAVLLYRYADALGYDTSARTEHSLSGVSDWAADAMAWAVGIGLLQGDEHGDLAPTASATRAQTAVILQRFVEHLVG